VVLGVTDSAVRRAAWFLLWLVRLFLVPSGFALMHFVAKAVCLAATFPRQFFTSRRASNVPYAAFIHACCGFRVTTTYGCSF